jgi:hypothetical protein
MMTRAIKGIFYRNSFIIYYYFSWFLYVVGMVLFGLVVFFIACGFNVSTFFSGCLLWLDGDGVVKIFVILSISLFLEFQVSICIDSLLLKEAFILCQKVFIFLSVSLKLLVFVFRDGWSKMLGCIIYGCLFVYVFGDKNFKLSMITG